MNKWQVFRDLTTARERFGISSRALTVLNALLSFHPATELSGDAPIIVFPSNRSLGERAHGMSEATLRRHIAALSDAGLLLRHDSPNGKRYACRDRSGEMLTAYGFDLRPLLVRAAEIAAAARQTEDDALRMKDLRTAVTLTLRDAEKLLNHLGERLCDTLAEFRRVLRRKLDLTAIEDLLTRARGFLQTIETRLPDPETPELHGCDSQTERHYQRSKPEDPDISDPIIPQTAQRLRSYCQTSLPTSGDLATTARDVSNWIGIPQDAWETALRDMGPAQTTTVVAFMLEKLDSIQSPGAYLRTLSRQAAIGRFDARHLRWPEVHPTS